MLHRPPKYRFRTVITVAASLCIAMAAAVLPAAPAKAQGSVNFVFEGAGWGHGVGMSQNGARNLATQGGDHVAILAFYYPNTIVSPIATLDRIRVHIGDATKIALTSQAGMTFERGGATITGAPAGTTNITAHDGGLQIGGVWTPVTATDPITVSFPMPVKVENNGHTYLWGKFQLTNRNGKVRLVEVLPLEDYVKGISEMPAAWPLEALMAQAIAARTYAHEVTLHRRGSTEWAQEYDISATTVDQNYIGWDAQDGQWDQKWLAAVGATKGVEIVDNNGPIRAYYSATNGGWTETAAYVFGNDVPYTAAGPDPYDAGGHEWTTWTRSYSQEAISRWLNASASTAVGTVQSLNVLGGAGVSARLDKAVVEIVGSAGTKRVSGKQLMLVINAGVFGEGGGLSTHLPGTLTTIGNGVSAGPPKPGGVPIPASITPDPIPGQDGSGDGTYVPPAGWKPEPGTGIDPVRGDDASANAGADDAAPDDAANEGSGEGYQPPPGWTPDPGAGVDPVTKGTSGDAGTATSDDGDDGTADETEENPSSDADDSDDEGFTPPPGWTPDPSTGVEPASVPAAAETSVPEGWTPDPATGVEPVSVPIEDATAQSLASAVASEPSVATGSEEFEVVVATSELAAEARERLARMQFEASVGDLGDIDLDTYVNDAAPRPVHGICSAANGEVTCLPIGTYFYMVEAAR